MRAFRATAALCLAACLAAPAPSFAAARHHRNRVAPRAVPLPPERPDIESMFGIVRRTPIGGGGSRAPAPDGLTDRPAE